MDLCNITEIKALLARHGFHFSKAKGQNFLTQSWVPQNIVLEAGIDGTCGVLEVGPGIGPLTQQLCRHAKKVVAVEVDRTLQPVLAETMAGNENLEIIFGDILKTNIPALVKEEFAGLRPMACANLPYYITTPVLAALLESRAFEAVTVMVQKEVAQRICSAPGRRAGRALVPEDPGEGAASDPRRRDFGGRGAADRMLTFLGAILAGLVCGVLSGFGIGGGSLLMVWMTAVLSMDQKAAQGVNLLYFLPCAACALIFHIKNRQIVWPAVWPAAAAGAVCAVGGALLAQQADAETLRKLFGGFLILVGLSEVFLKGLKKK